MIDFNKVSDSVISAFNNYMNDLDTFSLFFLRNMRLFEALSKNPLSYLMRYNSFRKPGKR